MTTITTGKRNVAEVRSIKVEVRNEGKEPQMILIEYVVYPGKVSQ